jgi:hypothetical protein
MENPQQSLFRNEPFFARSRKLGTRLKGGESKPSADKARNCAEVYIEYTAQGIPKLDTGIAEKGHFWGDQEGSQ